MFKQLFPTLLVPAILLGAGCTARPQPPVIEPAVEETTEALLILEDGTYTLDVTSSTIGWRAQKRVGAKHRGEVNAAEGSLTVEGGVVTAATMIADMATIVDIDLTNKDRNDQLVNHLKSNDFFAVETYPTATFTLTSVTPIEGGEGTYQVAGTMTIKGITNPIAFPAALEVTTDGVSITGEATLDRTLWDVRYGSDKFFDNLGNELIEDEFTLTLDLLFTK